MDSQELRKFLAGIGIAGLLAGTSLMAGGCATKSGWSGMKGDAQQAPATSSWSGAKGDAQQTPAKGSWSGTKQ